MMEKRWSLTIYVGLIVLFAPCSWTQSSYFTVTIPNKLRANFDYVVSATYHGFQTAGSSVLLNVAVQIRKTVYPIPTTTESILTSGTASIAPGTTTQLPIKIGDWSPGSYTITTIFSGPNSFTDTKTVDLVSKSFSALIQTDKSLYQPSQLVQFRVVLVDSNLVPYKKEPLMVQIKDPQDNIIQQWKDVQLDHGVFQEKLQLSDQPVMGDFSIIAQVGNDAMDKTKSNTVKFTVKEYVLPLFEVIVDTPYVTFEGNNDPTFIITTKAKYTFGLPVDGNLDLTITMAYCPFNYKYPYYDSRYQNQPTCTPKSIKMKIQINGTASVTVKASDLYDRSPPPSPSSPQPITATYRDTTINVFAAVTEGLTGIQRNQTVSMNIYALDKKLTINKPSVFKPGMPFQVTVTLSRQDNTPVINSGSQVKLTSAFSPTPSSTPDQTMTLSLDGVAVFTVLPPITATRLTLTANYESLTNSASVNAAKSQSTKYISINVKTSKPEVGKNLDVEVSTTFGMTAPLTYVVVGRGNIRSSGMLATNNQSVVTFSFPVTTYMAPHVRIVVFYIDQPNGEMIADSVDVNVGGTFRTQVSMTTSADMLEPGDNVTLTVNTCPDSLVALLGVDKSVLLMQAGNDITQEKVYNELQSYDVGNKVIFNDFSFGYGFWRRPNYGGSFQDIFSYAGLLLITNGNYYKQIPVYPPWYRRIPMMRPMMMMNGIPRGVRHNVKMAKGGAEAPPSPPTDASSETVTSVEPLKTRTLFPETFIWSTVNSSGDGSVKLTYMVPDSITSWIIYAYAVNNEYGLGIMESPQNITVYRKFFIVVNLPYSVVRNEIIDLQVSVFNYQPQISRVQVTLTNSANDYKIINPQNQADESKATITKLVQANGATSFTFRIQPTTVGQINLNFKATSPTAGDALIKQLLVKAEGTTEFYNKAMLIDLRNTQTFSTHVPITIPAEAITGSEYIEFSAIGDIMAPVLTNIKELIRMPSGCGEQNMINFVPDVVIMKYLQSTNSLSQDLKDTLINFLVQGYQRELSYKHSDGSYSAFGQSDSSGSTWLTAFVLKSFCLAKPYITIDDKVIYDAKTFLVKQQEPSGAFKESGKIIHSSLQGGSADKAGLVAFTLIAFLEDKTQDNTIFQPAINRAISYLEDLLDKINSVYDLSIVAYALQLANSKMNDTAFKMLQDKKIQEGDLVHWQTSVTVPSGSYSYYKAPSSFDVEATSYALLTYALRNLNEESLPILRWLIAKRNSLGGYSSSQDTVIGIQALATTGASFHGVPDSRVNITIDYNGQTQSYTLNKQNALVMQKTPLPKTVRSVAITATGNGVAIAQLSWNYNMIINDTKQAFAIKTKILSSNKKSYSLQVCAAYLGKGTTGMSLISIHTLSTYTWDKSTLPAANSQTELTKNELANARVHGTDRSLRLQQKCIPVEIPDTDTCVVVNAMGSGGISNLKDAQATVYAYYANYKKGQAYYNLPKLD